MKKTIKRTAASVLSLILALLMTVGAMPVFAAVPEEEAESLSYSSAGMRLTDAFPDDKFCEYVWEVVLKKDGPYTKYRLSGNDAHVIATEMTVNVRGLGIESLKGIEFFSMLMYLDCSENKLTKLDLSENELLTKLDCSDNGLTALNLYRNKKLMDADLSGQKAFAVLGKSYIDLGELADTTKLSGIKVDGVPAGKLYDSETGILDLTSLKLKKAPAKVTYCVDAGRRGLVLEVNLNNMTAEGLTMSEAFPDTVLGRFVWNTVFGIKAAYDAGHVITAAEAQKIAEFGEEAKEVMTLDGVTSKELIGIEFFSALKVLTVRSSKLEKLNLTANAELISVNTSGSTALKEIKLGSAVLENLNVRGCPIAKLPTTKLTTLKALDVSGTAIKALDVTKNKNLEILICENLGLTSLDLTKNTKLVKLDCSGNALTSLYLDCNKKLGELDCSYNSLLTLDVTKCTRGITVNANGQKRTVKMDGEYINLKKLSGSYISGVKINGYKADFLYDAKTGYLTLVGPVWTVSYDVEIAHISNDIKKMNVTLYNSVEPVGETLKEIFPDTEFRTYVWKKVLGKNTKVKDDYILKMEDVSAIIGRTTLDVSGEDIKSLAGIEWFRSLEDLDASDNLLTKLDVSENKYLTTLDVTGNKLTTLDVSKNRDLVTLIAANNKLTAVDLSVNGELEKVDLSGNSLVSINTDKLDELTSLDVNKNLLTALDLTDNTALKYLDCSYNKLTELDLSENTKLYELNCEYNALVSLDLSENRDLKVKRAELDHQTAVIEMTTTVDLEKLTGIDEAYIDVIAVNGSTKGFKFAGGVLYADAWIKTLTYEIEVDGYKTASFDMTVELVNKSGTEAYAVTYLPGKLAEETKGVVVYKEKNKSLTIKDALFTRTGFVQSGWALTEDGEKAYDFGDVYTKNEAITLYPVWSGLEHTVTFDANGGKLNAKSKTVTYGEKYGKLQTPTRDGYEFVGWYTEKNGGVRITAGNIVTTTSDETLYAHWVKDTTVVKYTLTFVTNGGDALEIIESAKGSVVSLKEYTTKRDGYAFAGWYLDSALTKKAPAEITLNSDITVYAKWTTNSSMNNFKLEGVYGGYTDVDESQWYGTENQGVIRDVTLLGIMTGDADKFRPTDEIKISELIKMAAVVHNTYNGSVYTFDQSKGTYWFDTYVEYAINNGIIKAGDFKDYSAAATRAEMAYIFAHALPEKELAEVSDLRPSDVGLDNLYAAEIAALYAAGIIGGVNEAGDFQGERTINRAEAAAIIVRLVLVEKRLAD